MGDGDKVLGVSVEGPPPVGRVHLQFRKGVSALYGMNGAGKTAVLDAIQSGFEGVRGAPTSIADVHVLMDEERDYWRQEELIVPLAESIYETWYEFEGELEDQARWKMEQLPQTWEELARLKARMFADEALAREVVSQNLMTFRSVGHSSPRWLVFLSVSYSRASRELRRLLDQPGVPHSHEFGQLRKTQTYDEAPAWTPIPLVPLCVVERSFYPLPVPNVVSTRWEGDLSRETVQMLREYNAYGEKRESPRLLQSVSEGEFSLVEDVEETRVHLSDFASRVAASVLLDAPVLECQVGQPDDWIENEAFVWHGWETASQAWVKVERLSAAQRRWAELAISLTLSRNLGVVLIDEPELALHRVAERHCVSGLHELSRELDVPIVVTTHSAEFLNEPENQRLHVSRGSDGRTRVDPLTEPVARDLDEGAAALGLSRADILQMLRVVVIVEGDHDVAVLEEIVGSELRGIPAHLLPMRGTHKLASVLDAQLLFRFTDAAVVVALDRVRVAELNELWSRARDNARHGNLDKALRILKPLREGGQ